MRCASKHFECAVIELTCERTKIFSSNSKYDIYIWHWEARFQIPFRSMQFSLLINCMELLSILIYFAWDIKNEQYFLNVKLLITNCCYNQSKSKSNASIAQNSRLCLYWNFYVPSNVLTISLLIEASFSRWISSTPTQKKKKNVKSKKRAPHVRSIWSMSAIMENIACLRIYAISSPTALIICHRSIFAFSQTIFYSFDS